MFCELVWAGGSSVILPLAVTGADATAGARKTLPLECARMGVCARTLSRWRAGYELIRARTAGDS